MDPVVLHNVCLHLSLDVLVSLRNDDIVKRIVRDKSFWKAKLEKDADLVLPDANIQWYIAYKMHSNSKLHKTYKLLYSNTPDKVRVALYLGRVGLADADPNKIHRGNVYTPLNTAIERSNLSTMLALLEDSRVDPYSQESDALTRAAQGWVIVGILNALLAIDNPDAHGKVTDALQYAVNYANVNKVKILLADRRSNPSSVRYTSYSLSTDDEITLRTMLEDSRTDVKAFIVSLFRGSRHTWVSLYADLALEYDRKQPLRSITREMYIEVLHNTLVDETIPLFLLDEFAKEGYTLTQEEKDLLVMETWTSENCRLLHTDRELMVHREKVRKALNEPRNPSPLQ